MDRGTFTRTPRLVKKVKTQLKKCIALLIVFAALLPVFSAMSLYDVDAAGTTTRFYNWKQYDPQWKDVYIGSNTIGNVGCYVTSAAMLIVYGGLKTEADFDPATFVSMLKEKGGFAGNLIYKGKINQAVPGFDYCGEVLLGSTKQSKTDSISYYLDKGYYIIAGVKNLGHYVAIREVKDNVVYMMDPASECNVLFDYYALSGVTKIFLYTSTGQKVPITENIDGSTGDNSSDTSYVAGIYETTSDLNLRESATTSSASLSVIPSGTQITVTETDGIWGKTTYEGLEGYVCLDYTTFISEDIYKDPNSASSEDVTSEDTTSEDITSEDTTSEDITSEDTTSEDITSNDTTSDDTTSGDTTSNDTTSDDTTSEDTTSNDTTSEDISSDYVSGIYKTTGNLYLREEPTTSSTALTVIPKGTEIEVTEISGKWGKTTYDGYEGYCGLSYTTLITPFEESIEEPRQEIPVSTITSGTDGWTSSAGNDTYNKGYYVVGPDNNLRLRSEASASSTSLAIMPIGTKLKVTEIKDGWGKVTYSQMTGWCSLEYCTFSEAYLESTTFSASGIVGILSEEVNLSSLVINMNYSDGSVYSIKNGISVSYTIPVAAGTITATATYNGTSYTFPILYTEGCTVKSGTDATYVVIDNGLTAEKMFGTSSVELKTKAAAEIDGVSFVIVKLGDLDGTGDLSATDYLQIKKAFLGNHILSEIEAIAADVNCDGAVNATDYLVVKTMFLE